MTRPNDMLILTVTEHAAGLVRARRSGDGVVLSGAVLATVVDAKRDTLALTNDLVVSKLVAHVHEQGWRGRPVWCVIGGGTVTCQYFDLPGIKPSALRGAVQLKLAQQLVYDVREASLWIDTAGLRKGKDGGAVGAVAVPTAQAKLVTDVCDRMGLKAMMVTAGPHALAELGRRIDAITGEGLEAIVNVAEKGSTLVVYRDGRAIVNTELAAGLSDLAAALMRPIIKGDDVVQLDAAAARQLLDEIGFPSPGEQISSLGVGSDRVLPLLEPVLQQFVRQLMQWMSFVRSSNEGQTVQSLCIVGSGALIRNFDVALGGRLQIPTRTARWTDSLVTCEDGDAALASRFGPAVGVALAAGSLPDLRPVELIRRQRIERLRRVIAVAGPAGAIGLTVIALLLRQVAGGVNAAQAAQASVLSRTAEELARWVQWQSLANKTAALDAAVKSFQQTTPRWEALFKELSHTLPQSVQITTLSARTQEGRLRLRVAARLHALGDDRDFDRLVENTLGVLQTSPFFDRVEVLSASRSGGAKKGATETASKSTLGSLVLDLSLCYPAERPPAAPTAAGEART